MSTIITILIIAIIAALVIVGLKETITVSYTHLVAGSNVSIVRFRKAVYGRLKGGRCLRTRYGHNIKLEAFFYDENTVYVSGKQLILHSFLFVIFNIFLCACLFKIGCQSFAF